MSSLSKIVAGVLLVAGIVLAFVAWRLASAPTTPPASVTPASSAAPVAAPVKLYPVVVAKEPMPAGTRIDSAKMLTVAQWQTALSGGYDSIAPLEGTVTKVDIAAGDPILPSLLAQGLARQLKPGERALAIAVDEVIGGGNRVTPGDWVDVFFMVEKGQEVPGGQARLLQSQLRVLAYGKASVDGPEEKPMGQPGNASNQPARTAVLAVPVEHVNALILASRSGRLQLALRPLNDDNGPDTQLFAQRGTVLQTRADLTPEQREALKQGPNRAFAGESLVQLDGTTPAARAPAAAVRGANSGGGGGEDGGNLARGQIRTCALLIVAPRGVPPRVAGLSLMTRFSTMKKYQHTTLICILSAAAATSYGVIATAQTTTPAPSANAPAPVRDLALSVKGQQTLLLDGTAPSRIAIGDPEVADVKVLPASGKRAGSLLIYGKKAGTTQLQIWSGNNAAPQVWNLRVGGSVQGALATRGIAGGANVDIAGDRAVVSGHAETPMGQVASAAIAASAVGGEKNVVDVSSAGTGGIVQVEVKVVEVSRSVMKEAGINWSAGGSGPWSATNSLVPTNLASAASGFSLFYDTRNFSANLRLLQTNGMARVLAEPTLVAMTGQSASFLAGGELPIPESGGLGTVSVTFKPFGIGLTVTPTVLSRDRISLKVAPEASELDYSNGIVLNSGTESSSIIPALRTRRADTTVELGDGESFVISGLVSRQTKAMVSKVPLLGDLPIIGSFFRSLDYTQEETELVIVVTPRLVRPIARGVNLPLPGEKQERADNGFNAWGYYLTGPMGGQQMPGFSR